MTTPLIMVIEDDPAIRKLILRTLEEAGFRARAAHDGLSAVHWARREHPDLILSDLILPGVDGGTTLLSIKDEPGLESTPIILVSGDGEISTRAAEVGAVDLVRKPFVPADLLRRVRQVLAAEMSR